tara:strand:+ start:1345 stop:2412 length:1068 start_codon:yes stop_codon:yes gene_type:complete
VDGFSVGVIEGFYGRPWRWEARESYAGFLKTNGFGFYIYAPKGDAHLRKRWRDPWPADDLSRLEQMAAVYRREHVAWGIGFSPYEIYLDFNDDARAALEQKIATINRLDPDIVCVLLDDMKGDVPDLAETQADVFNRIADLSSARRLIFCPTYYSFDPILEKVFGEMPKGYWETLGRLIDESVDFFWTGPKVCSTEYPEAHISEVADRLGRKPFLWDNYPVNDSESRSKRLYLGAYQNRPHQLADLAAGHAANPMNQSWLSRIPIWTLGEIYRTRGNYDPDRATGDALVSLCGASLANTLLEDTRLFENGGLDGIAKEPRAALIEKYGSYDSPFADEIVDWLRGGYAFDPACLTE